MSKLFEALKDMSITGEELARIASDTVNCMIVSKSLLPEIMEDSVAKEEFCKISIAFIRSMATAGGKNFLYDDRNKQACLISKLLCDHPAIQKWYGMTNWDGSVKYTIPSLCVWEHTHGCEPDRAGVFAYHMSADHRTLQQSFARLAFAAVNTMFEECGDLKHINEYMAANGYPDWTCLCYI